MGEKICTKCEESKPFSHFNKKSSGKFGLTGRCKFCISLSIDREKAAERDKRWRANNPEKCKSQALKRKSECAAHDKIKRDERYRLNREEILAKRKIWRKANPHKIKEQNRNSRLKALEEEKIRHKEWYKNNLEKAKEQAKKRYWEKRDEIRLKNKLWRQKNTKKIKDYYLQNKERIRLREKVWRKKNSAIMGLKSALKRLNKINQTPDCANIVSILRFYKVSTYLSRVSGDRYEVDHIIPLSKGGLHHEGNLQVILATINGSKGNSLRFRHESIKHFTDLPKEILDLHPPEVIKNAYSELNGN